MNEQARALEIMRKDPVIFFEKVLGCTDLQDYQKEILKNVTTYDKVSIRATHSIAKTWTFARVALWFLSCYPKSKVITTAPTYRQVVKLLWSEIRTAYASAKIPLGGEINQAELKFADDWFAFGFSPKNEAGDDREQRGSSFQGFHAPYIMVLFDEATGIQPDIWKMAEGLLTSGKIVKFVAIANPTTRSSEFFRCFSDPTWFNMRLSCFDSPNLKANGFDSIHKLEREVKRLHSMSDVEKILRIQSYKNPVPYLLSASWVLEKAVQWGVDHPLFQSKALGEFPMDEDNSLISFASVQQACSMEPNPIKNTDDIYIGVDVARYGEDKTVFTEVVGMTQTRIKKLEKRDTGEVTGELIAWVREVELTRRYRPKIHVLIDATGIGAGVFDQFSEHVRNAKLNWLVHEVHFGQGCQDDDDKKLYLNLKAKMFYKLADDIKSGLSLLDESAYLEQLSSVKYKFTGQGKIQIESKEDFKKRTGRNSPDEADSLALANFGRYMGGNYGTFSNKPINARPLSKQKSITKRQSKIGAV